jgi:hypothetical protein
MPFADVELPSPEGPDTLLWEVLYEAMGFHRATDPATGYQLLLLCQVLMARVQEPYDLVREREDMPAGAILLDPENALLKNLPFLAQFVGAKLSDNMDEAQQRAEIKHPVTWRRGQVPTIRLIAERELEAPPGEKPLCIVRPRTPEPGRIYIRTLLSQTPDPARVELELLESAIPAWDVLDYDAVTGVDVGDLKASKYKTVGALKASPLRTVRALKEALPGEL